MSRLKLLCLTAAVASFAVACGGEKKNLPPVAADDAVSTTEDTELVISALDNDSDPDGDALTISEFTAPTSGVASIGTDHALHYLPNKDFNGDDSFTYTISDGRGGTATATVTVSVQAQNDSPLGKPDSYTVKEDEILTVGASSGVLKNDSDVDTSTTLKATVVAQPESGALELAVDGSFVYTPKKNFNGRDFFTYKVSDGTDTSAPLTVTLTISAVNDAPVGTDDSYSLAEDATLTVNPKVGVLANDVDADGDALTVSVKAQPTHGTLNLSADGSFTYTPTADYNGTDTFTYLANDGTVDSAETTVTLTIAAVNDVPVFVKGADQTVDEDSGAKSVADWATGVGAGANNESAQVLTFNVVADNPALFSVQPAISTNGTLTFTPAANANGMATVTVTLSDDGTGANTSAPQTFMVMINPVNDAPSFVKGADQTVAEDSGPAVVAQWATAIAAGPADEASQQLTFVVTNNNAALFAVAPAITSNGVLTFTPAANANGTATVTVKLQDNGGTASSGSDTSAAQTFAINVTPVNDAPVAVADSYTVTEDTAFTATIANGVLKNDTDIENSPLTAVLNTTTTHGTLTLNANGTFTYTPAADYNGTDSFSYKANDGTVDSAATTVTLTITAVNDAPVGVADSYSATEDAPLTVTAANGVLKNDTDVENDALTAVKLTNPTKGTVTFNADGSFTYTPNANAVGTDSFTYQARDAALSSASTTVTIAIGSVNDAPSFVAGANQTVAEDTGATTVSGWATAISAGPSDESAQVLTFTAVASAPSLFSVQPAITPAGTLSFTPAPNAVGTATITVTLQDNGGTANGGVDTSAPRTFTITITGVNDAPSFTKGPDQIVNEDSGQTTVAQWATNLSTGPSDESAQTLTFTATNNNNALFSVQPAVAPNGALTFTVAPNVNGTAIVSVFVKDNGGGTDTSATQTFNITVNAVNDAPTFSAGAVLAPEDTAYSLPNWATGISPGGGGDEAGQTLTFATAVTSGGALFTVQPSVSSTGTLTFTPAPDAFGNATIQVTLTDSGGTANGGVNSVTKSFAISIANVNDAPSFSAGADQNVDENSGAHTVANWASAIVAGPPNENTQTLTFAVSAADPSFFSVQPAISPTGALSYTLANGKFGTVQVTVLLKDNGGTQLGGQDTSGPRTFNINVRQVPIAVADSFSTIQDLQATISPLGNDTGTAPIAIIGTGVAQHGSLSFTATTITYQPQAGYTGPDSFTYTIRDATNLTSTATISATVTADTTPPSLVFSVPVNNDILSYQEAYSPGFQLAPMRFVFNDKQLDYASIAISATRNGFQMFNGWDFTVDTSVPGELRLMMPARNTNQAGDLMTFALTNIKDIHGNLGANVNLSFTYDAQAPWANPMDNWNSQPNFRAIWSFQESMDTSKAGSFVFVDSTTRAPVTVEPVNGTGWFQFNGSPNDAFYFVPQDLLVNGKSYDISVASFTDVAGNPAQGQVTLAPFSTFGDPGDVFLKRIDIWDPATNSLVQSVTDLGPTGNAFLAPSSWSGKQYDIRLVFWQQLGQADASIQDLMNGGFGAQSNNFIQSDQPNDTFVISPSTDPSSGGFTYNGGTQYDINYSVSDQSGFSEAHRHLYFAVQSANAETVKPTVMALTGRRSSASDPQGKTAQIRKEEPLFVSFSETFDLRDLTSNNFQIRQGATVFPTKIAFSDQFNDSLTVRVRATDAQGNFVALAPGMYTLQISNVRDLAAVQNAMITTSLPFEVKAKVTAPNVVAVTPRNGDDNVVPYAWQTVSMALDDEISVSSMTDVGPVAGRGFRLEDQWGSVWIPLKGLKQNPDDQFDRALMTTSYGRLSSRYTVFQAARNYRFTVLPTLKNVDGVQVAAASLPGTIAFSTAPSPNGNNDTRGAVNQVNAWTSSWPGTFSWFGSVPASGGRIQMGIQDPDGAPYTLTATGLGGANKSDTGSPVPYSHKVTFNSTELPTYFSAGNYTNLTGQIADSTGKSASFVSRPYLYNSATLAGMTPNVVRVGAAGSGIYTLSGTISNLSDATATSQVQLYICTVDNTVSPVNVTACWNPVMAQVSRAPATGVLSYSATLAADQRIVPGPTQDVRAIAVAYAPAQIDRQDIESFAISNLSATFVP